MENFHEKGKDIIQCRQKEILILRKLLRVELGKQGDANNNRSNQQPHVARPHVLRVAFAGHDLDRARNRKGKHVRHRNSQNSQMTSRSTNIIPATRKKRDPAVLLVPNSAPTSVTHSSRRFLMACWSNRFTFLGLFPWLPLSLLAISPLAPPRPHALFLVWTEQNFYPRLRPDLRRG